MIHIIQENIHIPGQSTAWGYDEYFEINGIQFIPTTEWCEIKVIEGKNKKFTCNKKLYDFITNKENNIDNGRFHFYALSKDGIIYENEFVGFIEQKEENNILYRRNLKVVR
jgi:hypothetical protein